MMGQLLTLYGIIAILATLLVVSLPYVMFGMKLLIKTMTTKKNVGLLFIRNLSDNFPLPHIIDLRENKYEFKINGENYTYLIQREHFVGLKFLGYPTAWFDANNMVTSIGIHYHTLDKDGKPMFNEHGEPVISVEKPSHSLHPSLIKAILGSTALTKAIEEIFQKHKTQIYILGGIGIGIAGSLYLMYQMQSVDIPLLMQEVQALKDVCVANIPERVVING